MTLSIIRPVASLKEFSSLVDILSYRAENQPEEVAYTFLRGGESEIEEITYHLLEQRAKAIAAYLQSLKLTGERALLLYPPGIEYIAAFFGCLYAQLVPVPAYPPRKNQNLSRLQALAADAQPKIILTLSTLIDNLQNCFEQEFSLNSLQLVKTNELNIDLASEWLRPEINRDSLAFLQYTSGSTSDPKGVMMTHGNLIQNSAIIHHCFGHNAESKGVVWLPPYHDMGLIGGVIQPLYGGFPVTLMAPVDFLQKPLRWLQAISRYQATTSGGPNFAYDLCAQKITPEQKSELDLSSWEVAFTGAEPIRAESLERFAIAFESCGFRKEAFYPCYGLAESTLIVSGGLKHSQPIIRKFESEALEQNQVVEAIGASENSRTLVGCGKSWMEQEIVIVEPESKTACLQGQVGEIWVSGSSVAQGYWNQIEETQLVFNAYLSDTGVGPFLRTGDLGFVYRGELFVTGRIKDVIIIRGQNHYPQDIEMTVEKSDPSLRSHSGAAFAVEIKNSERLVIVQEVERSYLRKLNVKEVVSAITQAVAAQHGLQVHAVALVKTGSLLKTSSGKIRRNACKLGFMAGTLEILDDWSETPQSKKKFINLQTEIDSMLQQLQVNKQI
jgi:acyl-CoA synthetase (AMP-forming)/AMP-acid ligase II